MTISAETRIHAERTITAWLDLNGVPPLDLAPADLAEGGWKRHARCGQHRADAPSPELFFPASADSPETYLAQTLCGQCPVRKWCAREGAAGKLPGVWAGVFRDDKGRPAALCTTRGCRRYRKTGQPECRQCCDAAKRAKRREELRNERRKAERAAARQAREADAVDVPDSPAGLEMEVAAA